jgi:hypothetical protein
VDRQGRLYFQAPIYDVSPGQAARAGSLQPRDSVPLYRVDPRTRRTDTLAYVQVRSLQAEVQRDGGAGGGFRVGIRTSPYQEADVWGVLPDGTLLIARVRDYHVDVIAPDGRRTAAPPIPFERQPVPDDARRANPELPRLKPPFVHGASSVPHGTPAGTLWIPRTTASPTDPAHFDVVDRTGRLVHRVALPPKTRIVGFSERYVYAAREDGDGLLQLQRFAMP